MIAPLVTFKATSRHANERMPVTVVTGFLGSGKTTLVNHILSNRQNVRAAVLVNELGEIGIDNELIVAGGDDMIELTNGCICCSVNNDLIDSIVRVLCRPEPVDHIIVETTGIADPLPVALTFVRSEFREAVRLDAIVAVADAEQFSLDLFDSVAARNQLRQADAILVNKCDCVSEQQRGSIEQQLRSISPDARILRTIRCSVPLPLILDVDLFRAPPSPGHTHTHLVSDGFVAVSFASEHPFSVPRFQAFLDTRPPGLFRGKGFLWLAETGKRYVFHLVGDRFSLDEDDRADHGANRLVLIGRGLDERQLRASLTQCLAVPL
jgi:G3E family GTPase